MDGCRDLEVDVLIRLGRDGAVGVSDDGGRVVGVVCGTGLTEGILLYSRSQCWLARIKSKGVTELNAGSEKSVWRCSAETDVVTGCVDGRDDDEWSADGRARVVMWKM